MAITKSLLFFIAAGLCEIGGGYLMWLWLREGKSLWYALVGAAIPAGDVADPSDLHLKATKA